MFLELVIINDVSNKSTKYDEEINNYNINIRANNNWLVYNKKPMNLNSWVQIYLCIYYYFFQYIFSFQTPNSELTDTMYIPSAKSEQSTCTALPLLILELTIFPSIL